MGNNMEIPQQIKKKKKELPHDPVMVIYPKKTKTRIQKDMLSMLSQYCVTIPKIWKQPSVHQQI